MAYTNSDASSRQTKVSLAERPIGIMVVEFFTKHRFYPNAFGKLRREFPVVNVNQP